MKESRLEDIDALRGVAILMVVVNHAAILSQADGLALRLGAAGAYGVQLFFVISACTIFLTLERAADSPHRMREFFIRRLMRIVPVYWLAIALYAAVYGSSSRGWTPAPEAWHYAMHALLLNVLHPLTQSSAVPGGWSISDEVIFYLSVPLWFAWVTSLKRAALFAIASVVLGPLAVWLLATWSQPVFADVPQKAMALYWYRHPLNQLGCFAIGILLFHLRREGWQHRLARHRAAWSIGAAMLFAAAFRLPNTQHLVAAAFALAALLIAADPPRWLVNRAMAFAGRVSYSAYVLHFLALAACASWIGTGAGVWRFPLVVLAGIAITLPAAALSHRFVEQPFIRLGGRWIRALRQPARIDLSTSQRART